MSILIWFVSYRACDRPFASAPPSWLLPWPSGTVHRKSLLGLTIALLVVLAVTNSWQGWARA